MILPSNPQKASTLLQQTLVVGSISLNASLERLPSLAQSDATDVLELRLDCFPEHVSRLQAIAPQLALPLLVTARCPAEGGLHALSVAERSALLRPLLPHAAVWDVEIASLAEMADLVAEVRASPTLVLASFHDFTGTPSLDRLLELQAQALAAGADGVKFATTLRSSQDLAVLMALLRQPEHPPLSVMGMGLLGKISRLVLAELGSCLNYGYLDAPTVPGQWPAARLKAVLAEIANEVERGL